MVKDQLSVMFSMIGLAIGLVFIDVDHLLNVAVLHWFPITFFFLFFGIGLYVWGLK